MPLVNIKMIFFFVDFISTIKDTVIVEFYITIISKIFGISELLNLSINCGKYVKDPEYFKENSS